jgi:hypothetical protein
MENEIKELQKIINENEESAELGCSRSRGLVIQALAEIDEWEWFACTQREQEFQDQMNR